MATMKTSAGAAGGEPQQEKTESGHFLQGHAKRERHGEKAGDGRAACRRRGAAEHGAQAVAAPSRLGRFLPPDGVRGAGIGLTAGSIHGDEALGRRRVARAWRECKLRSGVNDDRPGRPGRAPGPEPGG